MFLTAYTDSALSYGEADYFLNTLKKEFGFYDMEITSQGDDVVAFLYFEEEVDDALAGHWPIVSAAPAVPLAETAAPK